MDMEYVNRLRQQKRKAYMKLDELFDLTGQLAQAVDRRDEVSTKMLLGMRQQPLLDLQEIEETIQEGVLNQPEEDARRLSFLLQGNVPEGAPEQQEETALRELCERNLRQLDRIIQLDRRISTGMGGNRSYYNHLR